MFTSIPAGRKERGHVVASDSQRGDPDDVPRDDAPQWHPNNEAFSGAV